MCEWKWALPFFVLRMNAEAFIWARLPDWQGSLGEKWAECFLGRFFGLLTAWSEVLSNSRVAAAQEGKISDFFHSILELRTKFGLQPEDFWNMDEKGVCSSATHKRKVIVRKAHLTFDRQRRTPQDRSLITLIECVNATGASLKPLLVLPVSRNQVDWYACNHNTDGRFSLSRLSNVLM